MRFKNLKQRDLDYIKNLYHSDKSKEKVQEEIAEKYGITTRTVRKWAKKLELNTLVPKKSLEFQKATERELDSTKKVYFFTSAQNATPVNKKVFNNIKAYALFRRAELVVIPIRYKNPTSQFTESKDDWWDTDIHEYMMANRYKIGNRLTVLADVKVQLTASRPLMSMAGLTEGESAVIAHPRQHFETLATLSEYHSKFLFTTGIITEKNYTDSKAGKRGEFHHTFGFVIVETDGMDEMIPRHVSIEENGDFYDLDYKICNGSVTKVIDNVSALVGGDVHVGSTNPIVHSITLNMLNRFNPKHYVIHDLMDGYSVNPHERKDPFISAEREKNGSWEFEKELQQVKDYIKLFLKWKPIIVKSNHDIFIDRFLIDSDWRKEKNKNCYLKYAYLKTNGELPNGILPYELDKEFGDGIKCLTEDSSFVIAGNELGQHGHLGASGSRGTPIQYVKLNIKTITGHTHSPFLQDGNMVVGTQTHLKLSYTKGMTKRAHSNAIVHINGKRQNLIIENGKYTNFL